MYLVHIHSVVLLEEWENQPASDTNQNGKAAFVTACENAVKWKLAHQCLEKRARLSCFMIPACILQDWAPWINSVLCVQASFQTLSRNMLTKVLCKRTVGLLKTGHVLIVNLGFKVIPFKVGTRPVWSWKAWCWSASFVHSVVCKHSNGAIGRTCARALGRWHFQDTQIGALKLQNHEGKEETLGGRCFAVLQVHPSLSKQTKGRQ